VHIYEAKLAGVVSTTHKYGASIYANHRRQRLTTSASLKERVKTLGVWSDDCEDCEFYPDCVLNTMPTDTVHVCGLIAYSRTLSYGKLKTVMLLIGYAPHKYVEMKLIGNYMPINTSIGITCSEAKRQSDGSLEADKLEFW
jgi:hypothetical protein